MLDFYEECHAYEHLHEDLVTFDAVYHILMKKKGKWCARDHCISIKGLNPTQIETKVKKICSYGADIVIEAVGKVETWQTALKLARAGGLVNFFGGCPKGTDINLDTFQSHYQELRTLGVFHHTPTYMKEAFEYLHSGKISMRNLVSHSMDLADLEQALRLSLDGRALKVAITMSEKTLL